MSGSLFSRLNCYLTGHDYSVRSNGDRIYLRCDACGHRSTGWSLADERHSQRPQFAARSAVASKAAKSSRRSAA